MSLAEINDYHKLIDRNLSPESLFLDPTNPRLITDIDEDVEYTDEEIISEGIQNDVLRKIQVSEYKVDDLINSIGEKGYIGGSGRIIVKKIGGKSNYLVLEGNRRSAAIKYILDNPEGYSNSCLKTLQDIPVQEFTYKENNQYTEQYIINIILGNIHILGALGWGAMERAHYIFRSYIAEINNKYSRNKFLVDNNLIERVSKVYSFTLSEIKRNLKVYRVYEQVKAAGHPFRAEKFTLIDLAIKDAALSKDYFEIDGVYEFSQIGIDRMITLCDEDDGIVTNPQKFKKFSFVYKNGTDDDIAQIVNKYATLEEVHLRVKEKKSDDYLASQLEKIYDDVKTLDISDISKLRKQSREYVAAKGIVDIVVRKLHLLIKDIEDGEGDNTTNISTIDDANKLNEKQLRAYIKEALRNNPNRTCPRLSLVPITLQYMGINARGDSRKKFSVRASKVIERMVKNGILQEYSSGTSERYRLKG